MRITTAGFYDSSYSAMAKLSDRAGTLQSQISSGKRLVSAADDPTGYQRLARIKRADGDGEVYKSNVALAQGLLGQTDTALGSIQTQLQQAQELMVQANNGTLNAEQRSNIANTVDSIRDTVLSLANGKDLRGQPLFGGDSGQSAFTRAADGTIRFTGSAKVADLPIGEGSSIQATVSGAAAFGGDGSATPDLFSTLADFASRLRSGGDLSSAADALQASADRVTAVRTSAGARAARADLESNRLAAAEETRAEQRSGIEDVDTTKAITELQSTMTALQATQASFSKLSSLSLFDYLR